MKPMTLKPHEIRRLQSAGEVLVVRAVKPQPIPDRHFPGNKLEWNPGKFHYTECNANWNPLSNAFADYVENGHCPLGKPGDRLWVREKWCIGSPFNQQIPSDFDGSECLAVDYAADEQRIWSKEDQGVWRQPVHMPRWASRFTVEVVAVECKRVQEVTPDELEQTGECASWDVALVGNPWCWFVRVKLVNQ